MSQSTTPLQLGDIVRADFRTSAIADNENTRLQKAFGFQFRYQPARIAIALSLSEKAQPPAVDEATGKPIKGDTLLGQDEADLATWIAVIVEHSGLDNMSRKNFQDIIAAHWAKGISMLAKSATFQTPEIEDLIGNLLLRSVP